MCTRGRSRPGCWQAGQSLQRSVHLLRRAFEQPTTPRGEQGVSTKQQRVNVSIGYEIGHMAPGVPWHFQGVPRPPQQAKHVALARTQTRFRDALASWAPDRAVEHRAQAFDAADVVPMVMRH